MQIQCVLGRAALYDIQNTTIQYEIQSEFIELSTVGGLEWYVIQNTNTCEFTELPTREDYVLYNQIQ